ncbi:MAG: GNAT family N-acetyltransferase [Rhizobacter sp.]
MADEVVIRRLAPTDLRAYKALRDEMLERYPEAFTSDAQGEGHRRAEDYLPRLGLDRPEGGHLTLGAWSGADLLGAIGLDRDMRPKVRHIGNVVGMMVRGPAQGRGIGRALLHGLLADAGAAALEMLTLTVTDTNLSAVRLYKSAGFESFGRLEKAIKLGAAYHAKLQMVKYL